MPSNEIIPLVYSKQGSQWADKRRFNREFKLAYRPNADRGKQHYIGLDSARGMLGDDGAFFRWLEKLERLKQDEHIRKFRRGFAFRVTRK